MSFNKSLPPSHLGNVQTSLTLLLVYRRLSIVKRLGGSSAAKVGHLFGLCMEFGRNNIQGEYKKSSLFVFIDEPQQFLYKSVEIEVIFNRFWVLERAVVIFIQKRGNRGDF